MVRLNREGSGRVSIDRSDPRNDTNQHEILETVQAGRLRFPGLVLFRVSSWIEFGTCPSSQNLCLFTQSRPLTGSIIDARLCTRQQALTREYMISAAAEALCGRLGVRMVASEKRLEQSSTLGRKLWWLILGRLGTALVLLLISTVWTRSNTDPRPWGQTLSVLLFVVGLTVLYSLAHRFPRTLPFQARIQFTVDILLVTWLVWNSDVIQSPYTALYIVIIATSSLFLGPRGALVTSVGCALAYTGCALAAITGLGDHPAQGVLEGSLSRTVQSVGLFNIAFFVVGLLSARLAEQQSGSDVRLRVATQSLANLRALHERIVESIRSGVVTTDLEGRIFTFNAAAEEITGYDEKDVRGQGASVFFGELTNHITNSIHASNMRATSPRFEADCLTAEGMRLRLGFSISPLSSETGETTGMVITFQDLTHIRALEETSRRQDQLAAIGRMAASIAHEIRNPLAAMRGSIQMLRHEMQGESSQTDLMEIILRESDRLNRIITDFLNYARPRSASHAKVDIGELLHQTFTLLRFSPEINERQSVEEEVIDGPLMADADAEQLQQVFWNLARNALQSMSEGGVLRARVSRKSKNRLRIMFSDTGRGMSPAQVEHLFEPFSSTTGGTGLGLSIVYQIIREHGGTINVRSREGQGTTITIELPSERGEGRTQESGVRSQETDQVPVRTASGSDPVSTGKHNTGSAESRRPGRYSILKGRPIGCNLELFYDLK